MAYGYHANSLKTFLLVKPEFEEIAISTFVGSGISVVTDGVRCLGSAIGTMDFVSTYIKDKVQEWQRELQLLENVASTKPHAAYTALIHGLRGRWA